MHYLLPDFYVIVVTLVFIILLVSMTYMSIRTKRRKIKWLVIGLTTSLFAVFVTCFIQMPVYAYSDGDAIGVKQLVGRKEFKQSEITRITAISEHQINNSTRLFGSGGLCGYIGWFKNPLIGKYYMITNNLHDLLLIETPSRKYVINCRLNE